MLRRGMDEDAVGWRSGGGGGTTPLVFGGLAAAPVVVEGCSEVLVRGLLFGALKVLWCG